MPTLWNSLPRVNSDPLGAFLAPAKTVQLRSLLSASLFEDLQGLRGRKVLLAVRSQLAAAIAMLELDGVVQRLVLCTPDLTEDQLQGVALAAEAELVVVDDEAPTPAGLARISVHA